MLKHLNCSDKYGMLLSDVLRQVVMIGRICLIDWQDPMLNRILCLLPGKSTPEGMWLPAWRHMLDCGLVMQRLYRQWIPESVRSILRGGASEEAAEQYVVLAALLHDIGKLTPVFSSKLLPVLPELRERLLSLGLSVPAHETMIDPGRLPHALAGAAWLRMPARECPHSMAAVIAAHHGKPASEGQVMLLDTDVYPYAHHLYGKRGAQSPQGILWDEARRSWLEYALACCGFSALSDVPESSRRAQMVLTGLLIVADWIASNTEYFPLIPQDAVPEMKVEEKRADAALTALALPFPLECSVPPVTQQDFTERFGFSPRPLQRAVMDIAHQCVAPGMMIIEAQMGVGKTEAALAAAEHFAKKSGAGGIFFALPTQATANGIFPRLTSWAAPLSDAYQQAVRLAHGTANMNQLYMDIPRQASLDADGLIVHPWMEGRKKALLANVVIGTVDQLLMAALRQKHVMLRHLGIAGKVVVIDECHAYDAYMSVYLECALQWLGSYKTPVILLSATLPAARRAALMKAYLGDTPAGDWQESRSYPLLTWSDGTQVRSCAVEAGGTSTCVRLERADWQTIPAYLADKLHSGGCAVVILNTVKGAQQMADTLRHAMPDKEIMLVHAQFMLEDRAIWEETLLKRLGKTSAPSDRNGLIVVATQVVEQSLDIDADVMITELCPMDLLLQRMGRLHRHNRVRPAGLEKACCAVLPAEAGAQAIYGDWLLQQTERLLPEVITLPEDIPTLVQDAYAAPSADRLDDPAWRTHAERLADQESRASTFRLPKCEERRRPKQNTINKMLDTNVADDETYGDATVRDGQPSIEVLMMVRYSDGRVGLVPRNGYAPCFDPTREPSRKDAMRIARQRIRLPKAVCPRVTEAITALEVQTSRTLPEWQQVSALRGELFLLLDEKLQTRLGNYVLQYDPEYGLRYWKEVCQQDG